MLPRAAAAGRGSLPDRTQPAAVVASERTGVASDAVAAATTPGGSRTGDPIDRKRSGSATGMTKGSTAADRAAHLAALAAPKIRFSSTTAPAGNTSRRTSIVGAAPRGAANAAHGGEDGALTPASSAPPTPSSLTQSARRRRRGSSVISTSSSRGLAVEVEDGESSRPITPTAEIVRTRGGHPFPLTVTAPQRVAAQASAATAEKAYATKGTAPYTSDSGGGGDRAPRYRGTGIVPTASPTLGSSLTLTAAPTRVSGQNEDDDEGEVEAQARTGAPPTAEPPYAVNLESSASRRDEEEDDESTYEADACLPLADTTGHSPIPPHLQRRVAHEQRRERERIRRRLNPSARTLRLSARLRATSEPGSHRGSTPDKHGEAAPRALHLSSPVPQPSPRVGHANTTTATAVAPPRATRSPPSPEEAEPEPTPPAPAPEATTGTVHRILKSRPRQSGGSVGSTAASPSRQSPSTSEDGVATPASAEPCPSSFTPVAYGRGESHDDGVEPSPQASPPQPVAGVPSAPRTVFKSPTEPRAEGKKSSHGSSIGGVRATALLTAPGDEAPSTEREAATAAITAADTAPPLSRSAATTYGSHLRRKPGATMTRFKSEGPRSAVALAAAEHAGPSIGSARVMKAPNSIIQSASESHGSPLRSAGCVPAISAKCDLLPALCAEDRHRTFTIVLDLDETMCNNRTMGPARLRPGVLAMLDDIRSLAPPPTYSTAEDDIKQPSATARLYEQAVARQMGCGPSVSAPSGTSARRQSTSPPAVSPGTTAFAPTWSEAERAVGPRLELVMWTASVEAVARPVLSRLDPGGHLFDQCIYRDPRWYREVSYTKDLRRLGRDMDHVTIVENAPSAVALNRSHAILVNDFVNNRSDRQLYAVRTILRDWIERARLSAQLPPRPIGSAKTNDTAPYTPETAVGDAPAKVTATPHKSSRDSGSPDSTQRGRSLSLSGREQGLVLLPIESFLAQHPFMNPATGYVAVLAARQAVALYEDDIPRRRERSSRTSTSRSNSSRQANQATVSAGTKVRTTPVVATVGKTTRVAPKTRTAAVPLSTAAPVPVAPPASTETATTTNTTTHSTVCRPVPSTRGAAKSKRAIETTDNTAATASTATGARRPATATPGAASTGSDKARHAAAAATGATRGRSRQFGSKPGWVN